MSKTTTPAPLRIAHFRKRAGLSQQALARKLRIRPETLSRLENGKQPLTEKMERLLVWHLNLTPAEQDQLLGLPAVNGRAVERTPGPGSVDTRLWLVNAQPEDSLHAPN